MSTSDQEMKRMLESVIREFGSNGTAPAVEGSARRETVRTDEATLAAIVAEAEADDDTSIFGRTPRTLEEALIQAEHGRDDEELGECINRLKDKQEAPSRADRLAEARRPREEAVQEACGSNISVNTLVESEDMEADITLLKVGQASSGNYYTDGAIESLVALVNAGQRKMFWGHSKIPAGKRNPLEWCSTLVKAWSEVGPDGKLRARGRMRVHDERLMARVRSVPGEVQASVNATGIIKGGFLSGGEPHAAIVSTIQKLSACDIVSYGGAVDREGCDV